MLTTFVVTVGIYLLVVKGSPHLVHALFGANLSLDAAIHVANLLHAFWAVGASVFLWMLTLEDERPPIERGPSSPEALTLVGTVFIGFCLA